MDLSGIIERMYTWRDGVCVISNPETGDVTHTVFDDLGEAIVYLEKLRQVARLVDAELETDEGLSTRTESRLIALVLQIAEADE